MYFGGSGFRAKVCFFYWLWFQGQSGFLSLTHFIQGKGGFLWLACLPTIAGFQSSIITLSFCYCFWDRVLLFAQACVIHVLSNYLTDSAHWAVGGHVPYTATPSWCFSHSRPQFSPMERAVNYEPWVIRMLKGFNEIQSLAYSEVSANAIHSWGGLMMSSVFSFFYYFSIYYYWVMGFTVTFSYMYATTLCFFSPPIFNSSHFPAPLSLFLSTPK